MTESAGDSSEQQNAEEWLLNELSEKRRIKLIKKRFDLEGARQIELDGFCESPLILCEAWSHIGRPVGCQKDKVMTDALKLIFVNKLFYKGGGNVFSYLQTMMPLHFLNTTRTGGLNASKSMISRLK